jgi:hypothetical protein
MDQNNCNQQQQDGGDPTKQPGTRAHKSPVEAYRDMSPPQKVAIQRAIALCLTRWEARKAAKQEDEQT